MHPATDFSAGRKTLPWERPDAFLQNVFRDGLMHFHHLVQINDPLDPRIEPLTREQLWLGLVMRAERPQYFQAGLDDCRIVARTGNTLQREMRFGQLVVRDRVTFNAPHQVHYEVQPDPPVQAASLLMRIEEPGAGQLFLRCEYRLDLAARERNDEIDAYRKSAYLEADIDMVRIIRQLAASGVLSAGGPVGIDLN